MVEVAAGAGWCARGEHLPASRMCVLNHQGSLRQEQQCHYSLEYASTSLPTSLAYVSDLVWDFIHPVSLCWMRWDCWAHWGNFFPPTLFFFFLPLFPPSFPCSPNSPLPSFFPAFHLPSLPPSLHFFALLLLSLFPSFLSHISPLLTASSVCQAMLGSGNPE